MRECNNCGARIRNTDKVCPRCKRKVKPRMSGINRNEEEYLEDIPDQPNADNSGMKKWILPICILAVVIIALVTFWGIKFMQDAKPKATPEVRVEPQEEEHVVDVNDLKGTLLWESDSSKVETYKQHTVSGYPYKKIEAMFQNNEVVREWNCATAGSKNYFSCSYVEISGNQYETIFVQNEDNSINVAELYINNVKQSSEQIVAYCDIMFVPEPVYIIPESDIKYLTVEDVKAVDISLLPLAIDEIYARHGLMFEEQDKINYFNAQTWYAASTWEVSLTEIEQENVKLIKQVESGAADFVMGRVNGIMYSTGSSEGQSFMFRLVDNNIYVSVAVYGPVEIVAGATGEVAGADASQPGGEAAASTWENTKILEECLVEIVDAHTLKYTNAEGTWSIEMYWVEDHSMYITSTGDKKDPRIKDGECWNTEALGSN